MLYKFIIKERKSPNDAFILGICIYGIFDFTNMAIFKKYEIIPSIIDTLWGGCLFYMVTLITYKIVRIKLVDNKLSDIINIDYSNNNIILNKNDC